MEERGSWGRLEGGVQGRWRKGIKKKKKITPHWLPIPCTFLREPKWKDTISLNEAGCKGRHKGDKIVQSRGHWHCLCCNYYTSLLLQCSHPHLLLFPPTTPTHTHTYTHLFQTNMNMLVGKRTSALSELNAIFIFSGTGFEGADPVDIIKRQICNLARNHMTHPCFSLHSQAALWFLVTRL